MHCSRSCRAAQKSRTPASLAMHQSLNCNCSHWSCSVSCRAAQNSRTPASLAMHQSLNCTAAAGFAMRQSSN
eukprot:1154925-Pelagomonas_calceolata.AAC.1